MNIEVTGTAIPRLPRREIVRFSRKVLRKLHQDITLSIAFVDDETMTELNRRFRRKNGTTDVLTFPGDEISGGEIIICVDQARRQAAAEKHSLATEVRFLLLHGILHSLGYDHETDQGEMNTLELDLRDSLGSVLPFSLFSPPRRKKGKGKD